MKWGNVLIAAIFEVGWVMGLKYADSLLEWAATIVCIVVSFYLLLKATTVLPDALFMPFSPDLARQVLS